MKLTETFTAKINEIKADVKGTLHTLKELEHDRSPKNSWTDDYMKVVMENQSWLIEKVESLRAKHVEKLVKENKELEATLKKLDDEYQKDIANAEGAKRSYKKQRDSFKEENTLLRETLEDIHLTAGSTKYEYNHAETHRLAILIENKARKALEVKE